MAKKRQYRKSKTRFEVSRATGTALAIGGLTLAFSLLYTAMNVSYTLLVVWAVIGTLLTPFVFLAGFWFGKVEVRGFFQGLDQKLDQIVVTDHNSTTGASFAPHSLSKPVRVLNAGLDDGKVVEL